MVKQSLSSTRIRIKHVWGEEIDPKTAKMIAQDIELGLKSIIHVRNGLLSYLEKATDDLLLSGIPLNDIESIISDANNDIFRILKKCLIEISYRVRNR